MLSALVNNLLAPHSNLDFPSYMCTLMISTISNQNYPRIQTLPIDEFIVNPKLPGSEISKLKAALRLNIYIILLRLLLLLRPPLHSSSVGIEKKTDNRTNG